MIEARAARPRAALNSLLTNTNENNAFTNQVNSLINDGSLTSAEGQALINAANTLKSNIGC